VPEECDDLGELGDRVVHQTESSAPEQTKFLCLDVTETTTLALQLEVTGGATSSGVDAVVYPYAVVALADKSIAKLAAGSGAGRQASSVELKAGRYMIALKAGWTGHDYDLVISRARSGEPPSCEKIGALPYHRQSAQELGAAQTEFLCFSAESAGELALSLTATGGATSSGVDATVFRRTAIPLTEDALLKLPAASGSGQQSKALAIEAGEYLLLLQAGWTAHSYELVLSAQ